METVEICPVKQEALEELPPLFQIAESKSISGFDSIQGIESTNPSSPSTSLPAAANGFESVPFRNDDAASQSNQTLNVRAVSISMPCSPLGERRVLFADSAPPYANKGVADHSAITIENPKHVKFHSQPISYVDVIVEPMVPPLIPPLVPQLVPQLKNPRIDRLKDKRYDSFKTWSGKLERQLSHIGGRYTEPEPEADASQNTTVQPLPVDRYFDALEGPELETLRPSEELLLPEDKQWPFLLRYPISSFGICLGTSSQAILWKALATSTSTSFLHVNLNISLVLWCISIALVAVVTVIYLLKVIFYFEAIRREYYHPIRVNFFFAPWIALLFLALGVPPSIVKNLHPSTWYILMAPLFCLELKIYGQWMSGGRRRLSKVANPSNHLAVVGNFVGALLGATMGLKEGPIFFFAVGLAHYTVLFVTLYQRLPTNETLPKDLHPVFFLFVAAPSVASMAWGRIQESFDYGSRIAYFIALFLYISLAVRVNFFRGFKFSLAWWAYTFPMTGAAIATIRYANEVKHPVTQSLAVILSAIATLIVTSLLVSTIIHAFVLKDLFPNDIAIAISVKRKKDKRSVHLKSTSSDTKTAEHVRTSRNSF